MSSCSIDQAVNAHSIGAGQAGALYQQE